MGIESDKLVFDYLSRVGDLAQTALPAAGRMRLVAQLRNDIDRAREKTAADSPGSVRRILGRIGSPDEVVEAAAQSLPAAGQPSAQPAPPPAPVPPPARPPRSGPAPEVPHTPAEADEPPPDRFVKRERPDPEWWRGTPGAPGGDAPSVDGILGGGWTGGLILSEFEEPRQPEPGGPAPAERAEPAPPPEAVAPAAPRGGFRLPFRRSAPAPAPVAEPAAGGRRGLPTGPLEALAAAGLVAGAVLTNYVLMAAGWLLAYGCRGIGRRRVQFAVLGLPGFVLLGALVWFWGRATGHWGARLSQAQFGTALSADFPVILRVAAAASALYLLWRGVLRRG